MGTAQSLGASNHARRAAVAARGIQELRPESNVIDLAVGVIIGAVRARSSIRW